jgi:stress response protein YsnF
MREKLDELARLHAHRFDDDVALSAWREATIGDVFPGILEYVRGLTAERDEAQSQYKQLTKLCKATEEREREYMAHAAGLRGALDLARVQFDWIRQNSLELPLVWQAAANANADTTAAIQRMPAQSLVKIQAKAIRAACVSIGTKKQYTANEVVEIMQEKADRLEATDGR